MQYDDQEGVPNTGMREDDGTASSFDLRQYLTKNGMSSRALIKMEEDIHSGDMNVNTLVDCDENELNAIANEYQLTILQRKSFIRAATSLKLGTNAAQKITKQEKSDHVSQFVFVSPEDQKSLEEMQTFLNDLESFKKKQCSIKEENKLNLNKNLKLMKIKANEIKSTIDNMINDIENNVCMLHVNCALFTFVACVLYCCFVVVIVQFTSVIDDDEKTYDIFENRVKESCNKITTISDQFKICLKNSNRSESGINEKKSILACFSQTKGKIADFLNDKQNVLSSHKILNLIDFDEVMNSVEKQLNPSNVTFNSIIEIFGHNNNDTEKIRIISPKDAYDSSSQHVDSGQQEKEKQKEKEKENKDISWKFDYFYDYSNKGSKMHGIKNDGKTIECKHNNNWPMVGRCNCFYCAYSYAMVPNTGEYTIRIKVNKIDNGYYSNIIGIISQDFIKSTRTDNKNRKNKKTNNLRWYNDLYDYIGWSSHVADNQTVVPYGLRCGADAKSRSHNIFRSSHFRYKSNNENYKDKLPSIKNGDVIVLSYDSDAHTLAFSKDNDDGELNSYIHLLPKTKVFYWFVGHASGQMSMSVVD